MIVVGTPVAEVNVYAVGPAIAVLVEFQPRLPIGVNDERVRVITDDTVVVEVLVVVKVDVVSPSGALYVVETYGGGETVMVSRVDVRGAEG